MLEVSIEMISAEEAAALESFSEVAENSHVYLVLIHPFGTDEGRYLKISRDITPTKKLLDKILNSIFIINAIGSVSPRC